MLEALEAADYQALNQRMARKADFSLHLLPRDLQTLSECAAAFSSREAAPFREGLTCYFDAEDRGLESWVFHCFRGVGAVYSRCRSKGCETFGRSMVSGHGPEGIVTARGNSRSERFN